MGWREVGLYFVSMGWCPSHDIRWKTCRRYDTSKECNFVKRVAIITMGVSLDGEKGYTRFRSLADLLVDAGYGVDLITTTFQHWEKTQRDIPSIDRSRYRFGLRFIFEPGYRRNIDLQRVHSHRIAARNLTDLLEHDGTYDLIYCEIPPNNVARSAAEFAHGHRIPFVVDVNDLWPEAMRMVADIPVICDIAFHPLMRDAERTYALASGIVGTSDEYRDRPGAHRPRDIPAITVYVGNELSTFDEGVRRYASEFEKPESEFWVTYAGTIGTSYDIRTLVAAGAELLRRGHEGIVIKILGDGPLAVDMHALARDYGASNVEFPGYTSYPKMAACLANSDVLVNSFVRKAPQSVATKVGDYLAAGKPMINTCMSPELRAKVVADGFGINIEPENVHVLADAIESLVQNPGRCEEMGHKARAIAEKQFDRPRSYQRIVTMIDQLTGGTR